MKKTRKKHTAKKRKPLWKNKSLYAFIFVFSFVSFFIYFFFFNPYFYIKDIYIKNGEWVEEPNIDKKSTFLISLKKIKKDLLATDFRVESVSVRRVFPDMIEIDIKEREVFGVWCSDRSCFFVDKKGTVFQKGEVEENKMVFYKDGDVSLGENILNEKEIFILQKIKEELKDVGIDVVFFNLPPGDRIDAFIFEGWYISFLLSGDIDHQTEKLFIVLEEKIKNRDDIEYIDLRYGDKVYFK